MSDFLRKYWFICLIALALTGGLIYYIADLNKDNVSAKVVDGKEVVASTSLGDVTSDDVFDRSVNFDQTLLYNMYRRAVVEQTVPVTDDMKNEAKTMARNIEGNMEMDATGATKMNIEAELASYGFEGDNALEDYAMLTLQTRAMNTEYVDANFDELVKNLTTNPRTVSIITMTVPNAEVLTDEAQAKKDSIDKALENGDSFADTATAFSEDAVTAAKEGFYGYIDSSSTDLDSAVVTAAVDLKKGEYSDWITTKDVNTGMSVLYRVYVNETDPKEIFHSDVKEVQTALLNAFLTSDPAIDVKAVAEKAKDLEITFENEDAKTKINEYIDNQLKGAESDEE